MLALIRLTVFTFRISDDDTGYRECDNCGRLGPYHSKRPCSRHERQVTVLGLLWTGTDGRLLAPAALEEPSLFIISMSVEHSQGDSTGGLGPASSSRYPTPTSCYSREITPAHFSSLTHQSFCFINHLLRHADVASEAQSRSIILQELTSNTEPNSNIFPAKAPSRIKAAPNIHLGMISCC